MIFWRVTELIPKYLKWFLRIWHSWSNFRPFHLPKLIAWIHIHKRNPQKQKLRCTRVLMIFHSMIPSLESNFWPTIKIIQKNIFYCKFKIHLHSSPNDATYIFTHLSPNYNWTNIYAILYKVSLCHSNKNRKRSNFSSRKNNFLHIFVVGWVEWYPIIGKDSVDQADSWHIKTFV